MTVATHKDWERELSSLDVGIVRRDEPMSRHTSFGIGGEADLWIHPSNEEGTVRAVKFCQKNRIPHFAIGEGSNLLVRDGGIRGVVIQISKFAPQCQVDEDCILHVAAGVGVPWLVQYLAEQGLSGMEFAAGIPGTVGGGLAGNSGTEGVGFGDRLVSARIVRDAVVDEIPASALGFGYRTSQIPAEGVVVSGLFRLTPDDKVRCLGVVREKNRRRRQTQPSWQNNAGCLFKNPSPEHPAGKLVDECGLKGLAVGNVRVSSVHANFLVNEGGGTARDLLDLAELIQEKVAKATGICLEKEIRVVGTDL